MAGDGGSVVFGKGGGKDHCKIGRSKEMALFPYYMRGGTQGKHGGSTEE